MFSRSSRPPRNGKYVGEMILSVILTETLESSENNSNSSTVHKSEAKPVEIDGQHKIYSVAFFVDGKHVVSGGKEGKIRRWRVEDGREVGSPMDAGNEIYNLAVSRDGKWIVSGTRSGELGVWYVLRHKKVTEWRGHGGRVYAVDISPDGERIATGSGDGTACVWSFSTGQQLLVLEHNASVIAAQLSPNGRLIATATWELSNNSVRVYDSQSGNLLVDVPFTVTAFSLNPPLVWVSNSKYLFALSNKGRINYLAASTGTTLSSWPIHSTNNPGSIALASNGTFIAASACSSVSLWDTTTHKQIGSIIDHPYDIRSIAISANDDIVIGGGKAITLRNIRNMLPSSYHTDVSAIASNARCVGFVLITKLHRWQQQMLCEQETQRMNAEKAGFEETIQPPSVQESSSTFIGTLTCASLTLVFIRQQNCGSREDRPAAPQPAL